MLWKLFAMTVSGVWLLTDAVVTSVPVVAGMNETSARTTAPGPSVAQQTAPTARPERARPLRRRGGGPVAPIGTPGISVTSVAAAGPPLVTVIE